MNGNYAEPPDEILCVNCGEDIVAHFHDDGGYWCHAKNGESKCGRPANEEWWKP